MSGNMWKLLANICFIFSLTHSIDIRLKKRSTIYLPYTYVGGAKYGLMRVSVEQLSYDANNKILYTVGDTVIHAIDMTDPSNMTILGYLEYPSGSEFTDVEFCGDHIFASMDNKTDRDQGRAIVLTTYDRVSNQVMKEVNSFIVGAVPDMVKPTSDCSTLVVAVEAEAYEYPKNQITDPPGLVVIIKFSQLGPEGPSSNTILDFKGFDSEVESLTKQGVRHVYQENKNPFSNDVEPEYIAISDDDTKAYITLQENNAIAVVDLQHPAITSMHGLGFKNWSNHNMDPSDKDGGEHMSEYHVKGIYQPDSTVFFRHQGVEYLAMANEGDHKDYNFGTYHWTEETRGHQLDDTLLYNIDSKTKVQLKNNFILGHLRLSSSPSGLDDGGFYRDLYSFGGRSWSIRRADDLSLVYDSGDEMATRNYANRPDLFNGDIESKSHQPSEDADQRSDNKGPETEDIVVAEINGTTVIFVTNERPGNIFAYTIGSDLSRPVFQDYYTGIPDVKNRSWQQLFDDRNLSEIDPEDVKFVSGDKSPTGSPMLVVGGSLSGTVSVIDVIVS